MKRLLLLGIMLSMLCFAFVPLARTITGTVTDTEGNPLIGVSVNIKGTKIATVTDAKGFFSITEQNEKSILVFSYVGFQQLEIIPDSNTNIRITLTAQSQALQDVMVTTSTGIQRQQKILGNNNARLNLDYALSGKVAGVYIDKDKKQYNIADDEDEDDQDNSWRDNNDFNREGYDHITENPFLKVSDNPLSTFSIDVDAASYSNMRRMINDGQLPPAGAIRIEELINYFSYKYPQPTGADPFGVNMELSACPWNKDHELVLVGLQGKKIPVDNLPASNLVFLIDVSGSMDEPDKLPLVKSSLNLLVDQLREQDKVAIVVYAGNAGLVLNATSGANKTKIKEAINNLEAGGSTAGGAGIQLAYKIAKENFVAKGNNRVILCTDGDFNVGMSSDDALETLIENERKSNVFLSVLGFGTGNYQDSKMQKLADKGNGNHSYIDGIAEAKKVLINEFGGTLFTIAKDVKLQVEFNPDKVKAYRLIGYENRMLAKEDFNNDKKDAGELGSGHTVTALYELAPVDAPDEPLDSVDALRYQKVKKQKITNSFTNEVMNVKLRYKQPDGDSSKMIQFPLTDNVTELENTSENFRFAAAVAEFGMLLRDSKYKGNANFSFAEELAKNALGDDAEGYRKEFITLVKNASALKHSKETAKTNE